MGRYIIRRLLQAIPLLLFVSFLLFALMQNIGDPLATMGGRQPTRSADRERLRRLLGLDQPIYMQYLFWLVGNGVLRGDFGTSLVNRGQPVYEVIWQRLPNTLLLMGVSEVIILATALVMGVYSALRQYSVLDNVMTTISFVAFSIPVFFVGLGSMFIFAVLFKRWGLPYLPTVGMFDPRVGKTLTQVALHMVLPLFTVSFGFVAGYSRFVRSTMLEVIGQDYIRTARAKGLPRRDVVFIHALKNASLPLVTIVGLDLPGLLIGALVTERIFAWPGMGRLFLDHVGRADTPVVMGILMMIAVAVVVFQLLTDIVYGWLDPRIRYT
jgi:peptide/nickel transport system permease protein